MENTHKEHKSKKRKHKSKDHKEHKEHKAHKEKRRHKHNDEPASGATRTSTQSSPTDGVGAVRTVAVPLLPPTIDPPDLSSTTAKYVSQGLFTSALSELDALGGGMDSNDEDIDSSDDDQPAAASSSRRSSSKTSTNKTVTTEAMAAAAAAAAIASDNRTFASMLTGLAASSPAPASTAPSTATATNVQLDELAQIQQSLQDQVNSVSNHQLIEQIAALPAMLFDGQQQQQQQSSHSAASNSTPNETSSLLAALNSDPSILAMKPTGLTTHHHHTAGTTVPMVGSSSTAGGSTNHGGSTSSAGAATSSSTSSGSAATKAKKAKKAKADKDGSGSSSKKSSSSSSNGNGVGSSSSSAASGSSAVNTVAAMAARALEQQDADILASDNPLHTRWMMATALKEKGIKYRTGTFSAQEDEIIRQTIRDYVKRHNMAHDAIERWFENGNGRGRFEKNDLKALWVEIAVRLQTRPLLNIYLHVRRMFHPQNNVGAWSKEDDIKLIELYTKYKGQWTTIGNELGRMADSCRDRYRNHLKDQSTMVAGPWSQQEDEKLLTIMQELAVMQGKSSILESQPMWTLISERMGGTRTRHQCRHRYSQTLQPRLERGEWTGPSSEAAAAAAQAAVNASSAAMAALEQQKAVQAAAAAGSGQSNEDALFIAAAMQMPTPTAASGSPSLWSPSLPDTSSALTNPATGASLMVGGGTGGSGGNSGGGSAGSGGSNHANTTLMAADGMSASSMLRNPLQPPAAPKGPIRRRGGLQQQLDVLKMIQESGVLDHTEIQWADIAARLRAAVQESNEAHLVNVTNGHAQLISQEAELQGGHTAVAAAAATAAMAEAVAAARAQAVQRLQKVPAANQIARTFMSSRCKTPNYRQLPLQEVVKLMMADVERRILRRQRGRRAAPRNLDEEVAGVKYDSSGHSSLVFAQQQHHQLQSQHHQQSQQHPGQQQQQQQQHQPGHQQQQMGGGLGADANAFDSGLQNAHAHHHHHAHGHYHHGFGEYALSSEMSESVQLQLNLQTQEVAERALSAQFPTIHRFQQEQALALQHGVGYVPTHRTEEEQQAMERQLQQEQHNRAMAENMLQMALASANIYTPHAASSFSSFTGGGGGGGIGGTGSVAHLSFHHVGSSGVNGTTLANASGSAGGNGSAVPGSPGNATTTTATTSATSALAAAVMAAAVAGAHNGHHGSKYRHPKSQEIIVDSEEELDDDEDADEDDEEEDDDDDDDELEDEELGAEIERDLQAMFGDQRSNNEATGSGSGSGAAATTTTTASGSIISPTFASIRNRK
ncbi:RNA polymerase I enhancer binding protein [Actinomortierella ambigua]|uniref:RNA polymerase I enhancer binding protein n=1 Tax=Actinomortierella ambigua TaxID=1343610 RepID=A0A9P6U260_9FUNG|nr:RNA polymerase I enhancer binding protein [Actinomortierella ambigua]